MSVKDSGSPSPGEAMHMHKTSPSVHGAPSLNKTASLQSAILNDANLALIATDDKGTIRLFNTGAERMLGYAADEMIDRVTPAAIADVQDTLARSVVLGRQFGVAVAPDFESLVFKAARGLDDTYELTCVRKDGSHFTAFVSVTALHEAHSLIGYLLIYTDHSACRQAEERLRLTVAELTRELAARNSFEAMPAAPRSAAAAATASSSRPQAESPATARTLLYVEDNPANLLLVEQIIARRPDVRLLSAHNGILGIEMARASRPDVILMDINLPGMSGVKAMQLLRADTATAHIPIVALSANALPRDIERGLAAGFFRYLTKPIRVGEFLATLDVALEFAGRTVVHHG